MHGIPTLTILFVAASACIAIVFIGTWLRNLRETRPFFRIGLASVLIILAVDAATIYLVGIDTIDKSLRWIFLQDAVLAVRIYAFTVVGLLLARRLNDIHSEVAVSSFVGSQQTSYGVSAPSRQAVFYALLATVFMLLYSEVLFRVSDAKIGAFFSNESTLSFAISPAGILTVACIAFGEEIIFRLGIQNGLTYLLRSSRYGHCWAVLGTAAFWSIGHIGAVDPDWVKIAQIFVFGLILGQMHRRFGVIPCVITHSLFNAVIALQFARLLGLK